MSFIASIKPKEFKLSSKGTYWVAPVLNGQASTILEPQGNYYRIPTEYLPYTYTRTGHPNQVTTITVDTLEQFPNLREQVLGSLATNQVYLEGYPAPKE